MNALTSEVLAHLVESYGGSTAVRGVWSWAGGREGELGACYDPAVETQWASVWERANGEEGRPSQLALVREALYDEPGHPLLLGYLATHSEEHYEAGLDVADLVREMVERLRGHRFSPCWLTPILRAIPGDDWRAVFAPLAPALNDWLPSGERETLAASSQVIARVAELVVRLSDMKDALRAAQGADDEVEQVTASVAELKVLYHEVLGWDLHKTDGWVEKLETGLRRAIRRIEFRKRPTAKMAVASLTSILISLEGKSDVEPMRLLGARARGLLSAVWATRPEWVDELADDFGADQEPEDPADWKPPPGVEFV